MKLGIMFSNCKPVVIQMAIETCRVDISEPNNHVISNNEIINRLKEGKQCLDRMPSYWPVNLPFIQNS